MDSEVGAINEISRPLSSGKQVYQESKGNGAVGKAVVHLSATKQVTGEAIYTDDIPRMHNELYGVVVGSTIAHGFIENVDVSEALKVQGVVGFVSREDVAGTNEHHGDPNMIGPVFHDEELFVTKKVNCIGQMIGIIVANTEALARRAAKLVKVTYKQLPALFTIEVQLYICLIIRMQSKPNPFFRLSVVLTQVNMINHLKLVQSRLQFCL